ncbi:hydroxypyruvate isomerase family protein [Paenibacillus arenilitoris]|uniref:TIM barrel protein n=1 Tax=Paenibacillus arenilitoris TaxID=2772299 RepID=A0A927H7V2_9BACL|nr:TIM barrel protein [Paenibacillus arenilitoris]MBD2869974.1 TIM barrel protein [Paenibacillus arenilitoris]
MRFSVVLDAVYAGKNVYESMLEVKKLGFHAVEFFGWADHDLQAFASVKNALGLQVAAILAKPVSMTHTAQRPALVGSVKQAISAARQLGCHRIIMLTGPLEDEGRGNAHEQIVIGLKTVEPLLREANVMAVLEPLNTLVDHPGYYLNQSEEAFRIVDEVDSPYVKVLYDIYHMQIMEGNIIATIKENIARIGHFHMAGVPGRHEPYTGELYYITILKAIEDTGYRGFVGLEYKPAEEAAAGLAKFRDWVRAASLY